MGALARLLVPSREAERRSLTVYFRPVSRTAADRKTRRAQMTATMAATIRQRVGQDPRARDRRTATDLIDRDQKLERGRSLVQSYAVATITTPASAAGLDANRLLDASARMCGFNSVALDGAHDAAFAAACIPLGSGLPSRRRQLGTS
jgi:hypothetical protein